MGDISKPVRVDGQLNLGVNNIKGGTFIYGAVKVDPEQVARVFPGAKIKALVVLIPRTSGPEDCFIESDPQNPNVFSLNPMKPGYTILPDGSGIRRNKASCLNTGTEHPESVKLGVVTDKGEGSIVWNPASDSLVEVPWKG
jgi:hypothetical protein